MLYRRPNPLVGCEDSWEIDIYFDHPKSFLEAISKRVLSF
jgi:hypothetical protein